ncbi:uncharacterized protein [Ptychodera flava]|uniref:uncharacterized protein n=1 Tax=Ptychodera flava TaxID=63121 RepID=UPI00396A968D
MACRIVKIFFPLSLSFLAFCVSYSSGRTAAEWKSRVVYQVVTDRLAHTSKSPTLQCTSWNLCGGTFKGIQRELDYIAGLGVNAIRISPFVLNANDSTGRFDYLGRWPLNIYKINSYFGTQQDLIDLVQECHSRDIWVMADLVIRNMGYQDGCFSSFCPSPERDVFNKFVPFDKEEHYDHFYYWANNLPRLNHTNSFVRTTLINWVREVATDYDIDGFCLDNVDGIRKDFLEELNNSTEIFIIGHASARGDSLAEYQPALDAVFDNDMQSALSSFFTSTQPSNGYYRIPDELALRRGLFMDSTVLGGYLDNVDTRRFLGVTDYTRLRNALAYLLMAELQQFKKRKKIPFFIVTELLTTTRTQDLRWYA